MEQLNDKISFGIRKQGPTKVGSVMTNSDASVLAYALKYFQNGWSVIPAIGKRPAIRTWKPYQQNSPKEKQIRDWFGNGLDYNIAIVTGKVSRLIAFDIDGDSGAEHFQIVLYSIANEKIIRTIDNTLRVKTSSGNIHVIIGFNPGEFENGSLVRSPLLWRDSTNARNEIRLKGEGGYIIAPPSIQSNGQEYKFVNEVTPLILAKEQIMLIISKFTEHKKLCQQDEMSIPTSELDEFVRSRIVRILKPFYNKGLRNDFILYLSGWLKKKRISYESSLKIIEGIVEDDEERYRRFRTLNDTYKKNDSAIKGYSGLLCLLTDELGKKRAEEILRSVSHILSGKEDNGTENSNSCPRIFMNNTFRLIITCNCPCHDSDSRNDSDSEFLVGYSNERT